LAYVVQQEDIELLKRPEKTLFARLELLNKSFENIEQLEGELKSDDYSIDADSDIRRTYNLNLHIKDSTFLIGRGKKIWFDKYIRLFIGIYDFRIDDIRWYPVGLYTFDTANYSYDATNKNLSLACLDRVAELNGIRNGKLSGIPILVPASNKEGVITKKSKIREVMIKTLIELAGITKFRVGNMGALVAPDVPFDDTVPYDIEFGTGATVWDIIKALVGLYPGWEAFFDEDYFVVQQIPTYLSDPVVLDAKTLAPLVISENNGVGFSEVYNVTEVWGKELEADRFAGSSSYALGIMNGNSIETYTLAGLGSPAITSLTDGAAFAFKATATNTDRATFIKINTFEAYSLKPNIQAGTIKSGITYVVRYTGGETPFFTLLGEFQAAAVAKLVSQYPKADKINYDLENEPTDNISYIVQPDNPFCSDFEDMGEIRDVKYGSDYEMIESNDLALQRARFENWKSSDWKNTINLTMIDIPWLNVNQKIEYMSESGETAIYLIKTKKGSSTGGTMQITAVKFQPLYPF